MTNRGQFAQLLAPGLLISSFDVLEKHSEEYSKFLEVDTDDGAYVEEQDLAGLSRAVLKPEGSPLAYVDPVQGGSVRSIHDTYALAWLCTKEMLADDKYSKIRQVPKELMPSLQYVVEQVAANILNLGFTTVKTADGVSLFNTAHPLLNPDSSTTTQSNQHATNASLSQTAVQDIMIIAENFVNDIGLKRYIRPTTLHIPPELQWIAKKIFNSDAEPGTANNDVNTTKGMLDVQIHHFFTSTTAWFVSTKGKNFLKFVWRQKPNMESADDFDTKGVKNSVDARFSAYAFKYPGWFGSTGAGS